ncbi:hypothetical protein [Photorhabdus bodei]|uniref:Uncharacterized protein n=1 Tax=Photorhabdus bodei TaxID=2029681 RepID=A0AAW6BPK7_9GAMM|nr:hypothetical protein [Photorhabdus bodei]MDB6373785.1 hypothetical protein [Photorhabdus bodei]
MPTYAEIAQRDSQIRTAIPPRSTAVPDSTATPNQRNQHLTCIREQGQLVWQAGAGRGHDSVLQDADWPALGCTEFCDVKDGSGHRNGRAQSAVSRYTPAFCPQGRENRLTCWEKGDF